MTARIVAVLAALAAACGPPGDPLDIRYSLSLGPENACRDAADELVMSCNDLPMTCESVVMLRIVEPGTSNRFIDECVRIAPTINPDTGILPTLCQLETAPFSGQGRMPTDRVEIQVAVFPWVTLQKDAMGDPICPADVEFTATGFASPSNSIQPAVSGRAFADGYDREVTVELGCHDLSLIDNDVCRDETYLDLEVTVLNFETLLPLSETTASRVAVSIVEPHEAGFQWVLNPDETVDLDQDPTASGRWRGRVPLGGENRLQLDRQICVHVQPTTGSRRIPTLACVPVTPPLPSSLTLTGYLVQDTALNSYLPAFLGVDEFPSDCDNSNCGLLLGKVIDAVNPDQGVPGAIVTDNNLTADSILYLSEDGSSAVTTGTTSSGVFMSLNAPMEEDDQQQLNSWAALGPFIQSTTPIGGEVSDVITTIVIEVDTSTALP
jgi:hypothetical protein